MEVSEITFSSVTIMEWKQEVCIRLKQRRAKHTKQTYLTFTLLFWSQNLEKPAQLISKQITPLLAVFLPLNGKSHRRNKVFAGIKFMIRSYFMIMVLPWDFHVQAEENNSQAYQKHQRSHGKNKRKFLDMYWRNFYAFSSALFNFFFLYKYMFECVSKFGKILSLSISHRCCFQCQSFNDLKSQTVQMKLLLTLQNCAK